MCQQTSITITSGDHLQRFISLVNKALTNVREHIIQYPNYADKFKERDLLTLLEMTRVVRSPTGTLTVGFDQMKTVVEWANHPSYEEDAGDD